MIQRESIAKKKESKITKLFRKLKAFVSATDKSTFSPNTASANAGNTHSIEAAPTLWLSLSRPLCVTFGVIQEGELFKFLVRALERYFPLRRQIKGNITFMIKCGHISWNTH